MITIANIHDIEPYVYDDAWAIVRSPKNAPKWMRHVPELSPSWELFGMYRRKKARFLWTQDVFDAEYVPVFIQEMHEEAAREKLNELCTRSRAGEHIVLGCFCTDVEKCHRSIIAGLLAGAGCEVELIGASPKKLYYKSFLEACG